MALESKADKNSKIDRSSDYYASPKFIALSLATYMLAFSFLTLHYRNSPDLDEIKQDTQVRKVLCYYGVGNKDLVKKNCSQERD